MNLLNALSTKARTAAHPNSPHPGGAPCTCPTTTLADRPDATVVRHAGTVAKAHAPHTDPAGLSLRLATAARLPDILLPPLTTTPSTLHAPASHTPDPIPAPRTPDQDPAPTPPHRLVTLWPYGTPVAPDDPDAAPWEAAATLLARLHRSAPGDRTPPPPMRGPAKAAHALTRLRTALSTTPHPAGPPVLRAWSALPAWARAEAPMPGTPALCHGDLHLGQLVRHPAPDGPWRLIDVDDLGPGVPAWDLARPAAWYACGLLPPGEWARFLAAYREAGGPAVPADGDPWAALDVPARALTAQTAARVLTKAIAAGRPLDEVEGALIDACARMSSAPGQLASGSPA
ncbi:aminoglycoside phosphotransferase family protein [Streptomyces sp. NPDC013313]|uniref:phosphotransferase family protein n=1 Tax=Streptomyces sp. NPDC013313 TaxID=3155603 RepID=UPI0033C2F497